MNTPDEKAKALGLEFKKPDAPTYLNPCVRTGNLLISSGQVGEKVGKLGETATVEEGYTAARQAMSRILNAVWVANGGTLNNIRVLKLLGCVNATPDFKDCPKVINGASDLVHEIFGKDGAGFHARSALGFATLPGGFAVEVEAMFEIVG